MEKTEFNKTQVKKYLIWTFVLGWLVQTVLIHMYNEMSPRNMSFQLLLTVAMFMPLAGVFLSGYDMRKIGWKPHIAGGAIFAAWILPYIFVAIGSCLCFWIFPELYEEHASYTILNNLKDGKGGYVNVRDYVDIPGIVTIAPVQYYNCYPLPNFPPSYFNLEGCYYMEDWLPFLEYFPIMSMFLSIGETAGWTGFLCPQLKAKFGSKKGLLIGGCLYGVWHFPMIAFTGYQYGFGYFGFPVTGLIVFCITSTAFLIICDWLYEKGECIWIPALFRGVLYVAGMSPLVHSKVYWDNASLRLLGPLPTGLLSGVFFIAFAAELLLNSKDKKEAC